MPEGLEFYSFRPFIPSILAGLREKKNKYSYFAIFAPLAKRAVKKSN